MWVRDPIRIVGGAVVDDGLFVTMQGGTVSLSRAQDDEFNFYYDHEKWSVNFDDVACNVAPPEAAIFWTWSPLNSKAAIPTEFARSGRLERTLIPVAILGRERKMDAS